MKHFFKTFLIFLSVFLAAALLLDSIYTTIISQSSVRNKVENVIHSKNKKYDVVFMGTSRANNHFVPQIFEDKGYTTFNFGMSGSHMFETALMLKLMIANKFEIKNLILEADLSVCNEKRDEGTTARFMPYIHENEIIKKHYNNEPDFYEIYYLPFYRYIKFDSKIGFRELWKTIKNEPTSLLNNKGYYPLFTTNSGRMKNDLSKLKPIRNHFLDTIIKLCKENEIKLILVMTPMCENTKGMEYFEKVRKIYPEIYNFESAVKEDKYFSSCGHMNDEGAKKYTNYIIEKFNF